MGRGSKGPWSTLSETPRHTLLFGDTLSGTSWGLRARSARRLLWGVASFSSTVVAEIIAELLRFEPEIRICNEIYLEVAKRTN